MGRQTLWGGLGKPPSREVMAAAARAARTEMMDRIRENRGKRTWISAETVNDSINQTFSRTILTGGTVFLTVVVLIVLGGTGIRPFAYTFMIGLLAGTYSSVAIAAPLVYSRKEEEVERARAAIAPVTAKPQAV